MIKYKISAFLFLLYASFSSFAYDWQKRDANLVELFQKSNLRATNVMVGDSITQYGSWQDLLSNSDIANRGIGGDTSTLILQRMGSILAVQPQRAFLMLGINDFGKGEEVEVVFNNYEKIITILQNAHIRVIISSTIKCNTNLICKGNKIINAKVDTLNSQLKNFSAANGITFIDIDSKLSNDSGLNEKYTADGVHLNLEGYREWAKMLYPIINAVNK